MNDYRHFSLGTTQLNPDHRPPHTHHDSKEKWARYIVFSLAIFLLLGLMAFLGLSARMTQALQFDNKPISFFEGIRLVGAGLLGQTSSLAGEEEGRVNILLLGRAGTGKPGGDLTDTIMLLSIDTRTKRLALLSFPRDLLVPFPEASGTVKINTLYPIGLREKRGATLIKASVSEITGLPVHYFASIDFEGFERVIDALGGITLEVPRDISDTRYPGPNYSYETFAIKKGWQKLDGKTALKYARVRHGDPEGDFGRAKRQQQILEAVRHQAWSLPTFLNPLTLTSFIESLGGSVTTDLTPENGRRLMELGKTLDTQNIATSVIDAWKKESLLRVEHIETSSGRAFALVPRSGNWKEVQTLATTLFDTELITKRRSEITREAARVLIVVPPKNTALGQDLAQDIRDTFPLSELRVVTWPALTPDTTNTIIGSAQKHLFTLDSLVGRYALTLETTLPNALPAHFPKEDLVILYTKSSIPGLVHEIPPEDTVDFLEP